MKAVIGFSLCMFLYRTSLESLSLDIYSACNHWSHNKDASNLYSISPSFQWNYIIYESLTGSKMHQNWVINHMKCWQVIEQQLKLTFYFQGVF